MNVRINRNILECKVFASTEKTNLSIVLIETYWNVKNTTDSVKWETSNVLIETYWNVKFLLS